MNITPGRLALGFLFLMLFGFMAQKAAPAVASFGTVVFFCFLASIVCGLIALFSRGSRIAGAIVLVIDGALAGYFVLVITHFNIPW